MHKDGYSLDELPYRFSRSSIKFLGNMGWKISDLNKVWIRLLGWSQLSNPSDLPCLFSCKMIKQNQLENHLVLLCHFCEAPFLLSLVHTKLVCNTSLHVPTEITERVKTGNLDQMFCIIRYQYVSKQFSVRRSRLYSVRSPLVSSSDRVKSPVHVVGTTFPNSPSPSAVRWNPFRPSCTSFPLRPIPF